MLLRATVIQWSKMADPGKYNRPFTWLRRSVSKDNNTGQDVELFTANGTLWGSIQELSASKRLAFGMQNSQADVEIHIRQFPTLDPKDRLTDKRFSKLLVIDGINHDFEKNEIVVYAHSVTGVYS